MANIPPKTFYKLTKEEQETEAVRRMNQCYQAAEEWKKLAQEARRNQIQDKEIDRPDLIDLKS